MLPLTFAVLAILTGALILLRVRWHDLSQKTHTILIACACASVVLYAITFVTGWNTASDHLNALLYWLAIAGYEFFLLLFTLLRPRWLTTIIAIILLLPIFSASPFLPLEDLFHTAPHTIVAVGPNFISDRAPWGAGTSAGSGFDLIIYSYPSWTHLLRHRRQASHYFNSQCNAAQASARLEPDGRHILMSCPALPNQEPYTARNLVVKLY